VVSQQRGGIVMWKAYSLRKWNFEKLGRRILSLYPRWYQKETPEKD